MPQDICATLSHWFIYGQSFGTAKKKEAEEQFGTLRKVQANNLQISEKRILEIAHFPIEQTNEQLVGLMVPCGLGSLVWLTAAY